MPRNTITKGVAYEDQAILGTKTNDNQEIGYVGEYIQATVAVGAAVALTTGTPANVTSIVLTQGDWDVDCVVDFLPAASTSVTQYNASVSATSATLAAQPGANGVGPDATITINQAAAVPAAEVGLAPTTVRVSIAAQTTIYMVAEAAFTVSTMTAYGTIRARRMA